MPSDRGDETDLEVMLEDDRDRCRHADAEQRDADRHEHGHDRAERDQQDDDRQARDRCRRRGRTASRLGCVEDVGDRPADHDVDVRLLAPARSACSRLSQRLRVIGDRPRQVAGAVGELQTEVGDRRIGRRHPTGELRELDRSHVDARGHDRLDAVHAAHVLHDLVDDRRVGRVGDVAGLGLEHERARRCRRAAGKSAASRSNAVWDSVPGIVKLSVVSALSAVGAR